MSSTNYTYQDNLQTDQLVTRFLTEDDIGIWVDFFKDKEAVELFPFFEGSDMERTRQWIEKQLKRYADKAYGLQALISKETGEFIGQCGLLAQEVDGVSEIEVGYHVFKQYWGNGYAPEAARLFIDYAFKNNLTDSVISIIDKRNLNSQRVAEKNGLVREKETICFGIDAYIYRIKKGDWKF